MKKIILSFVFLILMSLSSIAQMVPSRFNVRGAEYPMVDPVTRQATFKIMAPAAVDVLVQMPDAQYQMVKDEKGEWSVTTPPLPLGFHYYFFLIDGVEVNDPGSESFYGYSKMASAIEIPESAEASAYYSFNKDIAHGQVRECHYYSSVENAERRCFVYTPSCYDDKAYQKTLFPVLYLQHGMGEDERGWHTQGFMANIMDNLIASSQAAPMLVVMDFGNCSTADGNRDIMEKSERFTKLVVDDLIPFIDRTFRVNPDREFRAMAGLSWGGYETFETTMKNLDKFSYIGSFSGALRIPKDAKVQDLYDGAFSNPSHFNKMVHVLFISTGDQENIDAQRGISDKLKGAGINTTFYVSEGTAHEWLTWRRSLNAFVPLIFRPEYMPKKMSR